MQMLSPRFAEALACILKHTSLFHCSLISSAKYTDYLTVNLACRSQKQIPKSLDVFGWCTWDAFYFRVSAKGIIDGLRSLKDAGVSPKLLVIDDGEHAARPTQHMSAFGSTSLLTACVHIFYMTGGHGKARHKTALTSQPFQH